MKMDLALNNLQWLICHKTKQNQPRLYVNKAKLMFFFLLVKSNKHIIIFNYYSCILFHPFWWSFTGVLVRISHFWSPGLSSVFKPISMFCAGIICEYDQILIFCIIPSGLPFPPCHAYSCTPFGLICCICWSCD